MKSNAILLAAALVGAGATLASPVLAKEKKEEAAQPGLQLSKEFREQAVAADAAVQARNADTAEPLVAQLESSATTDDERYIAAAMRLNIAKLRLAQPGTSEQSLKGPLDTLIANPKTPVADQATYNYQRAVLAYNARDYKGALGYLDRAKALGSTESNIPLLAARARLQTGDVAGGNAALEQAMAATTAAGGKPDEQVFRFALAQSAKGTDQQATLGWIERYLAAYPTKKNWRDMVIAWGVQSSSMVTLPKPQKVDLLRLLRAGNALQDQYDYEQYGQWAVDAGMAFEAKAVLNEGMSNGKIPASSKQAKELLALANSKIANDASLSAQETRARSGNGRVAAAAADGYLGTGNNAKAVELYRLALQKGDVDAGAVNLRLGTALLRNGDREGARAAFAAVTTWPMSGVARLWTTYLDHPPA